MAPKWKDRPIYLVVEANGGTSHIPSEDGAAYIADDGEWAWKASEMACKASQNPLSPYAYAVKWTLTGGLVVFAAFHRGQFDPSSVTAISTDSGGWASLLLGPISRHLAAQDRALDSERGDPFADQHDAAMSSRDL